jgi:photosystem II stability/assembly factor-like uncharacterized protein
MNHLLHTLFFLLLASRICFAQPVALSASQDGWFWQNPLPQGNTLNSVKFISASVGWAVGDYGTILRTTDGGITWTLQIRGTTNNLSGVSFTDANTGTAVGDQGTILRTTDGGTTWTSQTSGTKTWLQGVSFTDANNGIAVGDSGTILRTTNGGTTWTSQSSGSTYTLLGVSFTGDIGTAVGQLGTILRTTNGGTTWTSQSSGTDYWLYGVSFTDANTGTAVGDAGTIRRTINGGTTWTSQSSVTTYCLNGVSFTDANNGTVVGYNYYGTILRTTNGGTTWTSQSSGTQKWLYGVTFTDTNNGTAVGGDGTILRTTNGGTTWTSQSSGTTEILRSVSFVNSNTGWCAGDDWYDSSFIYKTSNGGMTWSQQLALNYWNSMNGISFLDSNTGIAVGGRWGGGARAGTACLACGWWDQGIILLTNDGGATWEIVSNDSTQYLTSVTFKNEGNGWAIGGNEYRCGLPFPYDSSSALILHTSDRGVTWVPQYEHSLESGFIQFQDIFFTDTENGTVVGGRRIFRTTNSGATWTRQASWIDATNISLNSVCFLDENKGFVFGFDFGNGYPILLKTFDGGENWTVQQFSADISDAAIIGPDRIIAVGDSGKILITTNNGDSWTSQSSSTTNNLFCVSFSDMNNGWVVGDRGTILHTTNGGATFVEEEQIDEVPTEFLLAQNYPNPFNPSTKIKYQIPASLNPSQGGTLVTLKVFDILGSEVATLINEEKTIGTYELTWNATYLPSGVYFYQLKAGEFIQTKKMLLLK